MPAASGKKGKKKAAAKEQPALSPTPDCSVRVARDPAETDDAVADGQGISGACFCSGGEIMVAYGSDVKPTFVQAAAATLATPRDCYSLAQWDCPMPLPVSVA